MLDERITKNYLEVGNIVPRSRAWSHHKNTQKWELTLFPKSRKTIVPTYELDDVLMVELLHDVGLLQELLRHAGVRLHLAGLHSDIGSGGWRVGGGGGPVHAAVHVAELSLADDLAEFYPRSGKRKKAVDKRDGSCARPLTNLLV